MKALIEYGIVEKSGATRNAKFRLTADGSWFATPPHRRPVVDYDPDRIEGYLPNQTYWLPEGERARFHAAAKGSAGSLDASTYGKQVAERLMIDLSWASSALEGNTYDYLDTEALIRYGEIAEGHDPAETTMILNHKNAIGFILDAVGRDVYEMSFAQRLHALLMHNLIFPEGLGRVRATSVRIGHSSYRLSDDQAQLHSDFGSLLWKASQVEDAAEASFLLLAGSAYLQSFVDGNKRLGRLLSNIPLIWARMPPLSFVHVEQRAYLAGVIAFYERGDTSALASVIADAYEASAPVYKAAVAIQRVPHSVEIKERRRIEQLIAGYIELAINTGSRPDYRSFLQPELSDLDDDEASLVFNSIIQALDNVSPVNCIAWGIPEETALKFLDLTKPPTQTAGDR